MSWTKTTGVHTMLRLVASLEWHRKCGLFRVACARRRDFMLKGLVEVWDSAAPYLNQYEALVDDVTLSEAPHHEKSMVKNVVEHLYQEYVDSVVSCGIIADFLRDFIPNPFRNRWLDPGCLTPRVVELATHAYQTRNGDTGHMDKVTLLTLADVLEEAGCTWPKPLAHLRDPDKHHYRGDWVVDCALGKQPCGIGMKEVLNAGPIDLRRSESEDLIPLIVTSNLDGSITYQLRLVEDD